MKRRIKLTESDLHRVIKESVKKVLKENREVFTINAFSIESESSIDEVQYQGPTYYSIDDAIDAARELAVSLIDYDETVIVTVYAGEYEKSNGDIYGEPVDVYTISNRDRKSTAIARRQSGYSSDKVNEYATDY